MRSTIAYYLFILYLLVIFRPVVPVVSDAVSHAFALSIHLATVHALYGSNHLDKELEKTGSDNNKKNTGVGAEEASGPYVPARECRYGFYAEPAGYVQLLSLAQLEIIYMPIQAPPPRSC
jgi:hypothetical protein